MASTPPFPYDEKTEKIILPENIERELLQIVLAGNKPKAVQKVVELTGAGLKVSKDYVDSLNETKK
jgi:ribosomal protein L7/L12